MLWFNRKRGFGYLETEQRQHRVFIRREVLNKAGYYGPRPGEQLIVAWKGRTAVEVW